jgi:hypothetical protein
VIVFRGAAVYPGEGPPFAAAVGVERGRIAAMRPSATPTSARNDGPSPG